MRKSELEQIASRYRESDELPDFRTFYEMHVFGRGGVISWAGNPGEKIEHVFARLADAFADYADFVVMVKFAGRSVEPEVGGDGRGGEVNEMVMCVAKALQKAHYERGRGIAPRWEAIGRHDQEMWMFSARAAIQAMREPTEAMIEAGNGDCISYFGDEPFPSFERGWTAAIDAALT